MDKDIARVLLAARGVPVAPGATMMAGAAPELPDGLTLPVVVKPADEGSSVGVGIVRRQSELAPAIGAAASCSDRLIVEQFVAGTEVNVALLDGEVLGAVEIETHREFYDYSAKYDEGGSIHHIPPRIPAGRVDEACGLAQRAYEAIGCAGAARVDLIVPETGPAIVLEVNTIPGMTVTSLLPEIALAAGLPFDQLVARIMEGARLHVGVGR
jgi:D-alanine-D-alanine ligase